MLMQTISVWLEVLNYVFSLCLHPHSECSGETAASVLVNAISTKSHVPAH